MVDARSASPLPDAIGPYTPLRVLGSGATARVFEAERKELGKRVAIKLLEPRGDVGETRFLREGRAAARVRHPHVVDVFDVGTCPAGLYLVMELVEGGTLASRVPSPENADVATALRWLLPVVSAVAAAHEVGVVHRDLKPANILVAFDARGGLVPKVADFGISKLLDEDRPLTGQEGLLGTPAYMAPEQMTDPQDAGPAADQYSLGVLLHLFVSGHAPYVGETSFTLMRRVVAGGAPFVHTRAPHVPATFGEIVARALSLDPAARFPSVRALGAALVPFADAKTRALWSDDFGDEGPPLPPLRAPVGVPTDASSVAGDTVDDKAAELPARPLSPRPDLRRRIMSGALVLAAVLGAGALVRAAVERASAPRAADFFANATPARSPVEGASQAYRLGLAAMRASAWESGVEHFTQAVTLDPELGAAQLRLAMAIASPEPEARRALVRAKVLRDTLSERDRVFLEALSATFFASPPDHARHVAVLRAGVARFPEDAELTMHLAIAHQHEGGWPEAARLAERALALEPDYPDALQTLARARAAAGDVDDALAKLARCTAGAPLAVGCLRAQANIRIAHGRCADLAPVLRRWATVDPRAFEPQLFLAGLLAWENKPPQAIQEAQRQRWIRASPADRPTREAKDRVRLALYEGKGRAALAQLDEVARLTAEDPDEEVRAWIADHRLFALASTGEPEAAARVATELLAQASGWSGHHHGAEIVPLRAVSVALDAGRLTTTQATERALDVVDHDRQTPAKRALVTMLLARTEPDARAALAALAEAKAVVPDDLAPELARANTLAGRGTEAREVLARATSHCDGLSLAHLRSRALATEH